jgi:hypothetical protein
MTDPQVALERAAMEENAQVEPVREVKLNGFSRSVPVYNLVGLKLTVDG